MKHLSYPKEKIKILLLEDIHSASADRFSEAGYKVEIQKGAMSEAELCEAVRTAHILGIRSRSEITAKVLSASKHLLGIGCFCIGTNQVELEAAALHGVPVFNAPFSNTRSVAELTLAEIIMLSRQATQRSQELHSGKWTKSASGCHEVRNRTIGIIGYGHIGPQVGLLAEAFGMRVVYFDVVSKLALGNAQALSSLEEVLRISDFVTLHVPETPETKNMIGKKEIFQMKKGSCLLNLSRGTVVDIAALSDAIKSGHLAGAGVDVYPTEPSSNKEEFVSELRGLSNVILTPHIGGSTEEAQRNIGIEVATALSKYLDTGSTTGAVNFPQVELPLVRGNHRIMNIHKNVPGVLGTINKIVADTGANIASQYLGTLGGVGYLIMDLNAELSGEVKSRIEGLETNIRTRVLY